MAKTNPGRLRVELLEAKQMLAGDVLVSVASGALSIQGDDLDNQIAITSGETPGSYVIQGLDGTNVRLADSPPPGEGSAAPVQAVVVDGIRGNARIGLGDGDDLVRIDDASFRGAVSIATGTGNDTVLIGVPQPDEPTPPLGKPTEPIPGGRSDPSVLVGRSLRIATGVGDDTVVVTEAAIRGRLSVATGVDADSVRLGAIARPPAIGDSPSDDSDTAPERERPALRVGGRVAVSLGAGEDSFAAGDLQAGSLRVGGGADADRLRLQDVQARYIALNGGRGEAADEVFAEGVVARASRVSSGPGDDSVRILDSAFGLLSVALGDGNDTLGIAGTDARVAALRGGAGDADRYRDGGDNRFRRQVVRGFEAPAADTPESPIIEV